jgi:hypothetical protein
MLRPLLLAFALFAGTASASFAAQKMNGFDVTDALIPIEQIYGGGPAKDGIPSIDQPVFVSAGAASFVSADDAVLGVAHNSIARAYPIRILNWHEVVNDRFGNDPVVITFCPLCGTGVAFDSRVDGRVLSFGVSGLLYNSDVLLYDRQTQSLWSQLLGQAISGPMKGRRLTMLALTHTSWADWRNSHPGTEVLSTNTGKVRNYARDAYPGYDSSADIMFPVEFRSAGFHPKERVLGVKIGEQTKAYPFVELGKTNGVVSDQVGGTALTIRFDKAAARATAHTADGKQMAAVVAYWFAWYTFNPKTGVFRAEEHRQP